ncbi:hypothetical protein ACU686_20140 [Yinghuangia aomiensis]
MSGSSGVSTCTVSSVPFCRSGSVVVTAVSLPSSESTTMLCAWRTPSRHTRWNSSVSITLSTDASTWFLAVGMPARSTISLVILDAISSRIARFSISCVALSVNPSSRSRRSSATPR